MPADLTEARAALAHVNAPTCGKLVYYLSNKAVLCLLPAGHHGFCSSVGVGVRADHLRAALAEVDRLTAEVDRLTVERDAARAEGLREAAEMLDDDDRFDPWPAVHRTTNISTWDHHRVAGLQAILDAVIADGHRAILALADGEVKRD